MKMTARGLLCAGIISLVAVGAIANTSMVPAQPSARLGIEMDVKPAEGKPGQFIVSSTVTDLENNSVIAKPQLRIASDKPARIETGIEGKWMLQIVVTADSASRKASYEATYTREGQVVSRQRLAMNLNG